MQVILVDDNPHVRDSLKQMLEQLSLEIDDILQAACDSSAFRLIRKHRPGLIIADAKLLLLSEASGLDQMYSGQQQCRLLVTSSYPFILKAFCKGGMDTLLKPICPGALEEVLLAGSDNNSSYRGHPPYIGQHEDPPSSRVM